MEFQNKVEGCLVGAVLGCELGFSRIAQLEKFSVNKPEDIFKVKLVPADGCKEEKNRVWMRSAIPFVKLSVEAYLKKQGRIIPEDFARLLKNDEEISGPVFGWDNIHTIQEVLKEGMHPRLSGFGATLNGLICASMPAIGIYHAGDPEYAYVDGVEISSVVQPKSGADWAGLCASAIAASFIPGIKPAEIVETVMKIAFQNNKDLFYQLSYPLNHTRWIFSYYKTDGENEFLKWWYYYAGKDDWVKSGRWIAPNPIYNVLPLIEQFGNDAQKTIGLFLIPGNSSSIIAPVIAGAILGALNGPGIFPKEWLEWTHNTASPLFPITNIVQERLGKERQIIRITDKLNEKNKDTNTSILFDKVYGCLLAGSIGNAMGSPVEGKFYWEIDKEYPSGIKTILKPEQLEGEDDNQLAMLLVETYLERNGLPVTARHFGKTWKERFNEYHFYPHCMGSAYQMIMEGWDPRIIGHWKPVTGSTVMCMEPVGIYHILDPEFAWIDAVEISYMYQRGLDVIAAAILSATVAEAFNPDATVESVCKTALSFAPKEELKTFDKRKFKSCYDYIEKCLEIADKYNDVFEVRKPLYENCLFYHPIDPLEVIGLSLAIFKTAKGDVRQAAIGGTNIGRDSDTIAGRAAMLSGVLNGAKNVPSDWIFLFKQESLERIKNNAGKLVDLIMDKKLIKMKNRQNFFK
ncbi:MAG: ADP-ribosylglycohydrolase family protein [Candidatus Omnitrophica bacterium]|nr:ADP-ribosylglycohydrolase family protein [Candidatus Omnitrophota bacterium]